jgi:hypothetical protein
MASDLYGDLSLLLWREGREAVLREVYSPHSFSQIV